MGSQFVFIIDPLVGRSIDYPDCAGFLVPVADVQSFLRGIVTKVVHVIPKVYGGDQIKGGAVVNVQFSLVASDKKPVRPGGIRHSLRSRYARNGMKHGLCADSNDLFRIISQRGNK